VNVLFILWCCTVYWVRYILLGVGAPFACTGLAVRVERVRESGLLSGVNSQVVVVFDLDPCNDVFALEERGEPSSKVLVALGLVEVIGDSNQLGLSELVGELFAASGSPIAGSADPGFLQRDEVVDVEIGGQGGGDVVVGGDPVTRNDGAVGIGDDVRTVPHQNGLSGVALTADDDPVVEVVPFVCRGVGWRRNR